MKIGIPKEIKNHEYRVSLVPSSVRELIHYGHEIYFQKGAGIESGFEDSVYEDLGAKALPTAQDVFTEAEMIVKVKEPQPVEYEMLRKGQILFTYLHLAADKQQAEGIIKSECTAIAYETVTDRFGRLPLLAPMSEVAGRMSIQVGAHHLEKAAGGSGVLLGGVPGVTPGKITIIGGGFVGRHAARMAVGLEADVVVIDRSKQCLRELDDIFGSRIQTIFPTVYSLEKHVCEADLVIGAVLIPGAAAPRLVTRDMLKKMRKGSVVVDVAIDQGGCFETSKPTSHTDPVYEVEGIVHYCVTNMPGAVPRTSAQALNNATLPFVLALANKGAKKAMLDDPHLLEGLNVHQGIVTHKAVADDLGYAYTSPLEALQA